MDAVDYVLSRFPDEQQDSLDGVLTRAAEALEAIVLEGPVRAMESFNRLH